MPKPPFHREHQDRFSRSRSIKGPRHALANDPKKGSFAHASPLRALAPGRAMEGQAGTASAPAPPRRSTRCHCVMRSGFSPSDEDEGGGARECHG